MNILAIANQKGGVGKTTTAINLAAALVHYHKRVLLVDMDPQGNATMGSGINKNQLAHTLTEALLGTCTSTDCVVQAEGGYDLLPANSDLTYAEIQLLQQNDRQSRLQQALVPLQEKYDFILIDCPPSLNTLTLNALVAADGLVVPMQCEYFSLEGITSLLSTLAQIQNTVNSHLQIVGILRTMFDKRSRLCRDVSKQLERHFGKQVFNTYIPRNIRVAEAPSHGLSTLAYDPKSPGAESYCRLAEEVLEKSHTLAAV